MAVITLFKQSSFDKAV